MKYINIALTVVILGMGFWLYREIRAPIEFNKIKKARQELVKQNLIDIRTAQLAYKDKYRVYTKHFDTLIHFINHDTLMLVKVIGNPDDSTQVTVWDTSYIPARDSLFTQQFNPDSLPYVPNGGGKKFEMDAGSLKKGKIIVQVFEAFAYYVDFLRDQDEKFLDEDEIIRVGSMSEASTAGNWE